MAAAHSTGASWSFPADLPGTFERKDEQKEAPPEPAHDTRPTHAAPDASSPQSEPSAEEVPPNRRRRHYRPRKCRICLEEVEPTFHMDTESPLPSAMQPPPRVTYESADGGRLLSPCKCKGSQKYVHEECLGAWRRADPMQTRNYWECPTCRYRYKLQRLTWSSWISSTTAQLGLTVFIVVLSVFLLGFVADPILNMYIDPYTTIATGGGPRDSLLFEDEPGTWYEHMLKGVASLGLVGFAKYMFTLSPFHWFNIRGSVGGRSVGGHGRDRLQQIGWMTVMIGVFTASYAIWKLVRAWSRRTLESASERVMDVGGNDNNDDEDD
ncbi:Putative Zinc finger, RING-CH-type, Zinc finger, RING/FYVE/PHD-type [Septoria linicola]|uniref:Zinc finger, RING-CH-type, Zinc finger, RING/FYVE/PHD-type n=1 Tax=Septoria linicola TaxID=215465 RepID=A0A9Q9AHC0_9PEZI|nr:putative Zinc finger, RING-CH-type, Zinc finger, RING/FYVE/PHD-type [Septoria linicola]USW46883.1 Putative Zinc finger, RING-CH-type, Zinc finger, RING/FYVE/PHD-type [Septoria linicola]